MSEFAVSKEVASKAVASNVANPNDGRSAFEMDVGGATRRSMEHSQPLLTTERLVLRRLVPGDASDLAELAGAVEVASMAGHVPYPLSLDAAREWIADVSHGDNRRCAMAILRRDRDDQERFLGVCGFAMDAPGSASIGYFIGRPYWGKGYATEAVRALIGYCITSAAPTTLAASHFLGNDASARVLEKLGFVLVGSTHGWCPVRRLDLPALRYSLDLPPARQATETTSS